MVEQAQFPGRRLHHMGGDGRRRTVARDPGCVAFSDANRCEQRSGSGVRTGDRNMFSGGLSGNAVTQGRLLDFRFREGERHGP